MPLQPGDALLNGQYRIVRQIGRGGFGYVYMAQHALLAEEVAVKELIPALVGDEELLKRFLAEARAIDVQIIFWNRGSSRLCSLLRETG
jgi:eukaryotic-like serine/threonine-protein kinase